MKKAYLPKSLGGKLGHLGEECAEVGGAVDKTLRVVFELSQHNPQVPLDEVLIHALASGNPELPRETRESNREWILREIVDLELAIIAVKKALS